MRKAPAVKKTRGGRREAAARLAAARISRAQSAPTPTRSFAAKRSAGKPGFGRGAMALLALFGLLLFGAGAARAATYYVGPGGSNANAGTSVALRWATIGRANVLMSPGDITYILPGSYTDYPNPANAATGGDRFYYYGATGTAAPIVVSGGEVTTGAEVFLNSSFTLNRPYVVIRGVHFLGSVTFGDSAARDSIVYCKADQDIRMAGADYCVLLGCHINTNYTENFGVSSTATTAMGDSVLDCVFANLGTAPQIGENLFRIGGGAAGTIGGAMGGGQVDSCAFSRDTITMNVPSVAHSSNGNDIGSFKVFQTKHTTFTDLHIRVYNNRDAADESDIVYAFRDSTHDNYSLRDTVIVSGTRPSKFYFSHSGSYPGGNINNTWDRCYFAAIGTSCDFQDGMQGCTLKRSTFVSAQDIAFTAEGIEGNTVMKGGNHIDFCTFAGNGRGGAFQVLNGTNAWIGTTTIHSSIFAALDCPSSATPDPAVCDGHPTHFAWYAPGNWSGHLVQNNNLFYESFYGQGYSLHPPDCVMTGGAPGDHSLGLQSYASFVAPGLSTGRAYGIDSLSVAGNPGFLNWDPAHFDPHLAISSPARGIGVGGMDAGALAYAGVPRIDLPLERVSFANGVVGTTQTANFTVQNIGEGTLVLSSIGGNAVPITRLAVTPASGSVPPGGLFVVTLTYEPDGVSLAGATLLIQSNDPVNPVLYVPIVQPAVGGPTPRPRPRIN